MAEGVSLINIGELSKPATVLIEKVAEAVGGVFRPQQIVRLARAEAKAELIQAETKVKLKDIEVRALHRLAVEEGQRQENIETITGKALPDLDADADPERLEKDWLTNFFDKARFVSDQVCRRSGLNYSLERLTHRDTFRVGLLIL